MMPIIEYGPRGLWRWALFCFFNSPPSYICLISISNQQ
jgi:hypothetical protein